MSSKRSCTPKRAKRGPKGNGSKSGEDVGYKKPPKHTRWKKGEPSPNPRGRGAKRAPHPTEMADAVSRMKVPTGDGEVKATAFEAVWQTAFNEALLGNTKARAAVLQQREAFEAVRPPPPEPEWRIRRVTTFHDGVPVEVVESPYSGLEGDPIPPPPKKRKPRRRKGETYLEIFDRIASTAVKVGSGGRKKRVSAEHALWLSIFADASQGDDKALRLLTRYAKHARNLKIKHDDHKPLVVTMNIGNAPIVHTGPKVSTKVEFIE